MAQKLDPTQMKDWQIAQAAETTMKPFAQVAEEVGLQPEELIPMGKRIGKVDFNMAFSISGTSCFSQGLIASVRPSSTDTLAT